MFAIGGVGMGLNHRGFNMKMSWRREILTFAYEGEHTPVLEDVNFSIAEGSIVLYPT